MPVSPIDASDTVVEAIVLCGLQASGKSTLVRSRWYATHLRLNLDMLRTRAREDVVLHACLAAKVPVVIDNTNPTRAQRQRYLQLVRAAGYERAALCYVMCSVDEALRRNAQRPESERVPELAIRGTAAKLQVPTLDEGWDALSVLCADGCGGFAEMEPLR